MTKNISDLFREGNIEAVRLTQWLDWAGGQENGAFIALPMIQRGSVWKPKQIIDLWDSLLRGMPLGCFMVAPMQEGTKVRRVAGNRESIKIAGGGFGLVDGQQRTLAMLIAWPGVNNEMDRRVWVDFASDCTQANELLFSLHVTTENHPFGFQRNSPSSRLSRDDWRRAKASYEADCVNQVVQDKKFPYAMPWHSILPVELGWLIAQWKELNSKDEWTKCVRTHIAHIRRYKLINGQMAEAAHPESLESLDVQKRDQMNIRIDDFGNSLEQLFKMEIPLIKLEKAFFDEKQQEDIDPPLAILFKRVGTGGTSLSDGDYAYSIIKHRMPESYELVEKLREAHNVASLLSDTDLVMTALRLASADFVHDGKRWKDRGESLTKSDFHKLISTPLFLADGFMPLIRTVEDKDGQYTINNAFDRLNTLLCYNCDSNKNGLPLYAYTLLRRPLIQVLLRWVLQVIKLPNPDVTLAESREEILRFIMFWLLCVTDSSKASNRTFEILEEKKAKFPGYAIHRELVNGKMAVELLAPDAIKNVNGLAFSPSESLLRGWKRFATRQDNQEQVAVNLYKRWWNNNGSHRHAMLLWLQREEVAVFQGSPVAGRDDETPYDYDHICPGNHWAGWTGITRKDKITDFYDSADDHYSCVGNSIGNLRVWNSSDNRRLGDLSPRKRLELEDEGLSSELLKRSGISADQACDWLLCSGEEGKGSHWTLERVQAFQRVVEKRTFDLYSRFFNELSLEQWIVSDSAASTNVTP